MARAGEWTRSYEIVPDCVVMLADGWPDAAFGNWVETCLKEAVANNSTVTVVYDLAGVENYDPEARIRATNAMLRYLPQIDRFIVFTRSRLVAMGAMVVNIALGGRASVFKDDQEFQQQLSPAARRALARLRTARSAPT